MQNKDTYIFLKDLDMHRTCDKCSFQHKKLNKILVLRTLLTAVIFASLMDAEKIFSLSPRFFTIVKTLVY